LVNGFASSHIPVPHFNTEWTKIGPIDVPTSQLRRLLAKGRVRRALAVNRRLREPLIWDIERAIGRVRRAGSQGSRAFS